MAFSMYNVFCDFTAGKACLLPETSMLPLFENENYAIYHAFFFCLGCQEAQRKSVCSIITTKLFLGSYTLFLIFTFNFFFNKHFLPCFLLTEALALFGKQCSSNKQIKLYKNKVHMKNQYFEYYLFHLVKEKWPRGN